jgi:hypothetical protein
MVSHSESSKLFAITESVVSKVWILSTAGMRPSPSVVVSILVQPKAHTNKINNPVTADVYWFLDT